MQETALPFINAEAAFLAANPKTPLTRYGVPCLQPEAAYLLHQQAKAAAVAPTDTATKPQLV